MYMYLGEEVATETGCRGGGGGRVQGPESDGVVGGTGKDSQGREGREGSRVSARGRVQLHDPVVRAIKRNTHHTTFNIHYTSYMNVHVHVHVNYNL